MKKRLSMRFSRKAGAGLLLFVILFSVKVFAGEIRINNGKTEVNYTENNYQKLTFTQTLSAIQFREIQTRLGSFTEFNVQGFGYSNRVGDPKLPVYHKLIEVPLNCTFEITYSYLTEKEFDLAAEGISTQLIPAQAPLSKNITDPDQVPFVYNTAAYQKNDFSGQPLVTVTPVGILRAANIARLDISPVSYNPVTGKIKVYLGFEATITFKNGNVPATLQMKKKYGSSFFMNNYNQIPNFKAPDSLITSGPQTYVIIAAPSFQAALQPFIQWKTQKGFKVIQAYTSNPAVGTTTTSIHNYLAGLYTNPPSGFEPQTYVLLVGDVAQIPAFTTGGHPSDLKYGEYTGDNLPEAYYGRFSANDLTQLQAYIDKTLEYEKYTMPNDAFLGEVTMVAGADGSHQMTWGNGQINYGTTYYFNPAHNMLSHTYLQPEPGGGNYATNIHTNVSNGVGYANYTAHGSEDGWADPSFSISDVAPLQNNHKYCLMVGNCCLTSKFSVTCFAEEITRATGKGALGYIGCSDYSYWDEDYWWGVGFKSVVSNPVYDATHLGSYDATFHDHSEVCSDWAVTMAQMVVGGNMAVEESSSGMKQYYWEAYTLLGDPSLSVYYGIPPAMTAQFLTPVIAGTSSLTVTTEPYAYVALSVQDTILLDAKTTDMTGIVTLNFPPVVPPDPLKLVITKQNRKPNISSIPVIPATGPYVVLNTFTVNDANGGNNNQLADFGETVKLNVTVHNMGVLEATNVVGTISTSDTNVTVTSNSYSFGSIPAGGSITGNDAFTIIIKDNVADQHKVNCQLTLTDGTNTWNSTLWLTLNAPTLNILGLAVMDPAPGGNNNGVLDPGETATLKIMATNTGHASVSNGIGHLQVLNGSGSYIIVSDPDQVLGTFDVNGSVNGYYHVTVNGITPAATTINLNNLVTAGTNSQYETGESFDLVIGQVPSFNMTNGSATTCNATFFDSGGENANYIDNEDFTMTFNPGTAGARVKAIFSSFDIEDQTNCNYDYLKVYDGTSASSPLLGTWCGTNSPGTVLATGGALTFVFHSDYSQNLSGWAADIKCFGGQLTLVANAFPPTVCMGSSSQLTALPTGGSGNYTYQWSPATYLDNPTSANPVCTPTQNTTYTVTVNDGTNSVTSSPITITVSAIPTAPVISENGNTLTSSAAAGNQWFMNNALIPGATQQTYNPTCSGSYYAVVADAVSGCFSEPSNSILYLLTGLDNLAADKMVSVFPNPFRDNVTISYTTQNSGSVKITLFDSYGKQIRVISDATNQPAGFYSHEVNADNLTSGIYYCKIQTSAYSVVKKLMLSR